MNKTRFTIVAMLAVIFGFLAYTSAFEDESDVSRSIRVKGVFVLVDEAELLGRLKELSVGNANRKKFLDKFRYGKLSEKEYKSL